MAIKKHGGKRSNAGRKKLPKDQKKVCVQIYEPAFKINAVGGLSKAKKLAANAITEAAEVS